MPRSGHLYLEVVIWPGPGLFVRFQGGISPAIFPSLPPPPRVKMHKWRVLCSENFFPKKKSDHLDTFPLLITENKWKSTVFFLDIGIFCAKYKGITLYLIFSRFPTIPRKVSPYPQPSPPKSDLFGKIGANLFFHKKQVKRRRFLFCTVKMT